MKIALTVKNTSRALNPKNDDVIIFNKEQNVWYVTTKEDLLKEDKALLDECKSELERLRKENNDFKATVAKQLYDMSEAMKKTIIKER